MEFEPTPRPDNVTDEDLRQWTAEAEARTTMESRLVEGLADEAMKTLFPGYQPAERNVSFITGEWLARELRALGATEEEVQARCLVLGQKICAAADPDPWGAALGELDAWKSGTMDEPGEALDNRLFVEQIRELTRRFGEPGPERVAKAARFYAQLKMVQNSRN